MTKFADQWEPNGPFGIVTDSNMSGGYRVVTNDADKSNITILPPERQKVGMLVYVTATNKTWRLTTVGVRSPGTETYSSAPVFSEVVPTGVGNAVSGGTNKSVLFIDSSGFLAQDNADFNYDSSTNSLTISGGLFANTAKLTAAAPILEMNQTGGGISMLHISTSVANRYLKIGRINESDTAFYEVGSSGATNVHLFRAGSASLVSIGTDALGGLNASVKINADAGIGTLSAASLDINSGGVPVNISGSGLNIGTEAPTSSISIGRTGGGAIKLKNNAGANAFVSYAVDVNPPAGSVGALTQRNGVVACGYWNQAGPSLAAKRYNVNTVTVPTPGTYMVNLHQPVSMDSAIIVSLAQTIAGGSTFYVIDSAAFISTTQFRVIINLVDLASGTVTQSPASFQFVVIGSPAVDRTDITDSI